jgi:hypothetical protein
MPFDEGEMPFGSGSSMGFEVMQRVLNNPDGGAKPALFETATFF